ncbi:hypothetical protein BTO05_02130 [Winogradskyella sp. PC-19]|uniref:hypothetical protein n=1 Tax=unclassified Winogradskyella TaxID=2615021 RepID=UPI000B3D4D24|nr:MULTISPECIES: hypothetical protein [unclassified Winogradskyella]ARV08499.1 hypothetical protein BTO05_02130 [Winogradskyella sp. PC-19]
MKKSILLLIAFVVVSNTVIAQEWIKYKSDDLEFIAMYPKEPKRTVQKIPTAVGELDMHMVMYSPAFGDVNAVYSVIRSDYPKDQFEDVTSEYNNSVLDGAVNGAVNNVKGTLVYDKKISLNGYPGREIKIQIDQGYIYMNAYLVENIMYISQVICEIGNDGNKNIKRFMDSFDIIKAK